MVFFIEIHMIKKNYIYIIQNIILLINLFKIALSLKMLLGVMEGKEEKMSKAWKVVKPRDRVHFWVKIGEKACSHQSGSH